MDDHTPSSLSSLFAKAGHPAVRFNFRGVGRSRCVQVLAFNAFCVCLQLTLTTTTLCLPSTDITTTNACSPRNHHHYHGVLQRVVYLEGDRRERRPEESCSVDGRIPPCPKRRRCRLLVRLHGVHLRRVGCARVRGVCGHRAAFSVVLGTLTFQHAAHAQVRLSLCVSLYSAFFSSSSSSHLFAQLDCLPSAHTRLMFTVPPSTLARSPRCSSLATATSSLGTPPSSGTALRSLSRGSLSLLRAWITSSSTARSSEGCKSRCSL